MRSLITFLLLTSFAGAQSSFEKGKRAFEQGDYETALKILKPLAEAGNIEAEVYMGDTCSNVSHAIKAGPALCDKSQAVHWYMLALHTYATGTGKDYRKAAELLRKIAADDDGALKASNALALASIYGEGGHGIERDDGEAVRWLRVAIENSETDEEVQDAALMGLGQLYVFGQGVPQNYDEAMKLFRKAADRGYSGAQWSIGNLYLNGQGVTRDYVEGVKWFRLAAEQGDLQGQRRIGAAFYFGWGVPQDYIEGHMWLNLAAAQGDEEAKKLRSQIAAQMTKEQVAEAQRLAREWKPKKPAPKK